MGTQEVGTQQRPDQWARMRAWGTARPASHEQKWRCIPVAIALFCFSQHHDSKAADPPLEFELKGIPVVCDLVCLVCDLV